jgi:hypothetical protein
MILSSVTKHVKEQNWFAVFVDFIIVVVGVFVGIQVSNWNQAQKDSVTGYQYIERIQQDLLATEKDMLGRMNYFGQVKKHALATFNALESPAEKLGQKFLFDSFEASQALKRPMGRDTYNELLSDGSLKTISQLRIRQRLAQYYRGVSASGNVFLNIPPYREMLRTVLPFEVQDVIYNDCGEVFSEDETGVPILTIPEKCELNLSKTQIDNAVTKLLAADLGKDLTRLLSDIELKLQLLEVVNRRTKELYDFLEENK